jgi:hypothetical protein
MEGREGLRSLARGVGANAQAGGKPWWPPTSRMWRRLTFGYSVFVELLRCMRNQGELRRKDTPEKQQDCRLGRNWKRQRYRHEVLGLQGERVGRVPIFPQLKQLMGIAEGARGRTPGIFAETITMVAGRPPH